MFSLAQIFKQGVSNNMYRLPPLLFQSETTQNATVFLGILVMWPSILAFIFGLDFLLLCLAQILAFNLLFSLLIHPCQVFIFGLSENYNIVSLQYIILSPQSPCQPSSLLSRSHKYIGTYLLNMLLNMFVYFNVNDDKQLLSIVLFIIIYYALHTVLYSI